MWQQIFPSLIKGREIEKKIEEICKEIQKITEKKEGKK